VMATRRLRDYAVKERSHPNERSLALTLSVLDRDGD
jgi:hypothetical protein